MFCDASVSVSKTAFRSEIILASSEGSVDEVVVLDPCKSLLFRDIPRALLPREEEPLFVLSLFVVSVSIGNSSEIFFFTGDPLVNKSGTPSIEEREDLRTRSDEAPWS